MQQINEIPLSILFLSIFLFITSCDDKETLDTIYFNGTIHTMDDNKSTEAVGVKEGKITMTGDYNSLKKNKGTQTREIDLEGRTMLPGFVDAHSHFSIALRLAQHAVLSPPPVGHIDSFESLLNQLKDHKLKHEIKPGEWIAGWGYDQDQLKENKHPNRYDLDADFPDNPVFILHISGHMAVVNSQALELLGISAESPDPEGGVIVRMPNSKTPSGLLQESAAIPAREALPTPSEKESLILLAQIQDFYAKHGITTAQDGFTSIKEYELLSKANKEGLLKLDIEVLAGFQELQNWVSEYLSDFGKNDKNLRLTGVKMVSDGSPQGKTAYFSKPYLTEVPGCAHTCTGVPVLDQKKLDQLIALTYSKGIQTFVHCNGDASIDLLLKAHEKNRKLLSDDDERTVIIHSQFVRDDQLDKYADYGMVPSFFSNHAFYWGDVHVRNLGEERANFLSPMKTALSKGITYTNHTDYIVTPLNQLFLIHTAVNRTSRSGRIIGEDERITPMEALKAITINAAYQHKIEKNKGSITVGKLADFVILNDDPISIRKDKIKDIQVVKTIKEDVVIFSNN